MAHLHFGIFAAFTLLATVATPITTLKDASPPPANGEWTWSNPTPQGNSLFEIAYGNGQFVAIGELGTILTSRNGINWDVQSSGTRESLYGVAWCGNRYVVVGGNGIVLTSPDGVAWQRRESATTRNLFAVSWNGSLVVAVGRELVTSPNGIDWTTHEIDTSETLLDVAWVNDTFVIVGNDATVVRGNNDDWTVNVLAIGGAVAFPGDLETLAWNGSQLVIGTSSVMLLSEDGGVNYEQIGGVDASDVMWANGLFVALDFQHDFVRTSLDGRQWTDRNGSGNAAAWGGNRYVTVGTLGSLWTSSTGENWTNRRADAADFSYLNAVVRADSGYVAVGREGVVLYSGDAVTWHGATRMTEETLYDVAWTNGRYVVVGAEQVLLVSDDGRSWTTVDDQLAATALSVLWDANRFVAVGVSGSVAISADGLNWEQFDSGTRRTLSGVTFTGSQYIAVGDGVIVTSPDAMEWTLRDGAGNVFLSEVAGTPDRLVAIGRRTILTSPDGVTWTDQPAGEEHNFSDVIWAGNQFLAVGQNGKVGTSPDGVDWTTSFVPGDNWLEGVLATDNEHIAVGWLGSIFRRDRVGSNFSGPWFNASQSGHGWLVEQLSGVGPADPQRINAYWYVYQGGNPVWLIGGGDLLGTRAELDVFMTHGADFPPDFDSRDVMLIPWGSLTFDFSSESTGEASWSSVLDGFASSSLSIERIAPIAADPEACRSGSYYNASQNGHGFVAEVFEVGGSLQVLIAWYVYQDGEQVWLLGQGALEGGRAVVPLQQYTGAEFPPGFSPGDVIAREWGTLTVDFTGPESARATWESSAPGFSDGSLDLVRLTTLADHVCE